MKELSCFYYQRHKIIGSQSEFFFITEYYLLQLDDGDGAGGDKERLIQASYDSS